MHTDVNIVADDFRVIHNGLCDLRAVCERLEGVLADELYQLLLQARDQIRKGLSSAYQQDEKEFDVKYQHYQQVRKESKFKNSEWSIYKVKDMSDPHPWPNADRIVYRDHWGKKPVSESIHGSSWFAIWRAADACIGTSGDAHHVYIEKFEPSPEDPRTLLLTTGS